MMVLHGVDTLQDEMIPFAAETANNLLLMCCTTGNMRIWWSSSFAASVIISVRQFYPFSACY